MCSISSIFMKGSGLIGSLWLREKITKGLCLLGDGTTYSCWTVLKSFFNAQAKLASIGLKATLIYAMFVSLVFVA
jgi:hypothetical protein